MAEKKVTIMVLEVVDLQSPSCFKKVKKLLYNFLEIRNQIFDEKQNTVTITVVCCSPEKIRDKLCRKGGKTIKCIQILEPPKPKPPEKPKEPEKPKPAPPPPPPKENPPPPPPPKENPPPPAPATAPAPLDVLIHAPEPQPPPKASEPPSLQRASEDPSPRSVAGPGPRGADRRLNLTKITMIFCLGVAGEMAVQTRTENPWSFHSLCLLLMLAFCAVFVATTIEFNPKFRKAAGVLESIATLFGITGFFLATTVALPLALKLVGWLIYALILLSGACAIKFGSEKK